MISMPVAVENKNSMIEMFEILAHFPNLLMMIKSGENTVDAHSIMGIFTIDETKPIELLFESEPDEKFKQAIAKFAK